MENKITEEQLNKIKEQQSKLNEVINEIGVLETTKHSHLHHIAEINKDIEEFKNELEKEYGAININLEDGTYTDIKKDELQEENV
jgi:hypothetical protein|tara:strand:+ start:3487 stop:3741 length:255 start_codon:yes stop_codon:yes gene_type:complete